MAHIAVIGAGFVGLSTAWHLMREGHSVTVLDPAGAAGGASFGNAGTFATYACIPVNKPSVFHDIPHFLLDPRSPFRLRLGYLPQLAPWLARFLWHSTAARSVHTSQALAQLLARAQAGYDDMLNRADLAQYVRPRECLYLYSSTKAFAQSQAELDLRHSLGVAFDVLDRDAVQALEPQLSPLFERGVLFRGSWHLSDPGGFLKTLQAVLQAQGLQVVQSAVTGLRPGPDKVVVAWGQETQAFDQVALCAGAYSRPLAAQCGDAIPLDTERGYHLLYPGSSRLISRPVGWAERGFYMTPMERGIRVAGSVELAGLKSDKHPGLLHLLEHSSKRALPGLPAATEPWLGFRPTLPDGLPVIGRSSASARVVYAFGHQHIGLTLGAVTGSLVADLVAGRQPALDLAAFAPTRFR